MMHLGITGERFGYKYLCDLLVQSDVLEEESVKRALSGKLNSRATRLIKIVYEVLLRVLLSNFHSKTRQGSNGYVVDEVMRDHDWFTSILYLLCYVNRHCR